MAALHFCIDGDKDISREAMEEFLRNVTFQALTNESDRVVIAFDKIGFLVIDLLEQFVKIEQELYKDSETLGENLDKTINQTDFDIEVAPEVEITEDVLKFQSGEKKLPPEPKIKTMPLTTNENKQIMKTNKNNISKLPLHLIKQILTWPLKMQKNVIKKQY